MIENHQKNTPLFPFSWLPYAVALGGIILSIGVWIALVDDFMPHSIQHDYPWIILIFGIFFAILAGLLIRLIQLTDQRKKSLDIMNANFQKEIADRIHAEETKQKLEKALLQGQKLQAIGTLAGGIAHDFNNILYAIIGYVEMAREDVPTDDIVHKNLGKVLDACKRGQDLVARILGFSRRQHHDFKSVHVKETIEGVLGLLKPTIPASVDIKLQPITEDCVILGDQTQLHQVIVNIINNAVDAMEGEGSVTLKLNRVLVHDKIIKQFPHITKAESYCRIDMTDTGHGMDQSTMARIFEPFYTTKEVGKGTGLGLATVHSIVQEHQGEIVVESRLGHGTTFILLFPEYKENSHGKDIIS
ncbi:MAG: Sensor protein [uncultured bacterium]|nr:MAG: Sensor protein [uncultured bacterium]